MKGKDAVGWNMANARSGYCLCAANRVFTTIMCVYVYIMCAQDCSEEFQDMLRICIVN